MKLYWYRNDANFGDALSPLIVNSLMAKNHASSKTKKIEFARPSRCEAVCIGSVLSLFLNRFSIKGVHGWVRRQLRPTVHVWGTGIVNMEDGTIKDKHGATAGFMRRMCFHAVRGKLTRSFVERLTGKSYTNLPLGDPGLLASNLVEVPISRKSVGIIPHYTEHDSNDAMQEYYFLLKKIRDAVLIDVRKDPLQTLKEIAQCRTVISTAMHGLIAADSLHIPNIRYKPRNVLTGGGNFKFIDYYSVYKSYRESALSLDDITKINDIEAAVKEMYSIDAQEVEAVKEKLICSFPF